ncbi:MAG: response regulator [Alphaproteobacteria bacterium]|nr:response regulator [Alphaproteobacteria bacterium]
MGDSFLKRVTAGGIAGVTLLTLVTGMVFYQQGNAMHRAKQWLLHTHEVTEHIQHMLNLVKDAELRQRGYLITGSDDFLFLGQTADHAAGPPRSFLAEYSAALKMEMDVLRSLTADNPTQQHNLAEMEKLIRQKQEYWQQSIQARQASGAAMAAQEITAEGGKPLLDSIRALGDIMLREEAQLLTARTQIDAESTAHSNNLILAGIAVFFTASQIAILLLARQAQEKMQVQQALRAQKDLLETIVEALPLALFAKDVKQGYRFILWNTKAEELFDIPRAQMLGSTVATHFPSSEAAYFHSTDEAAMAGGKVMDIPVETITTSRGSWLAHTRKVPIYDRKGQPAMLFGIVEDITERQTIERMKNEFISTVSHELRTPLTSIRGSLGLLLGGMERELPGKALELLKIAYSNSERLVLLINDILDIEKIEAGQMRFVMKSYDVEAQLQRAVRDIEGYAQKFNIRLEYIPCPESITILIDADRFQQVLTNLLSNAVKFSHPGGAVMLRAECRGDMLRVSVIDHGEGIEKEFHHRIFQRFAQADSSDSRSKGGTGLGLNITKAIMEKMGGTIDFESEKGKGSTFFIDIPIAGRAVADTTQQAPAPAVKTVLVCENNPDTAKLLSMLLEHEGYATELAFSISEAREKLGRGNYAAMTLDLILPDGSGVEFMRELRAQPEMRSLPIIVISAKAEAGCKELNGDAHAVVDWLPKPINSERLVSAIEEAVFGLGHEKPKILHVEDDKDLVKVLSSSLDGDADITPAYTIKDAEASLRQQVFDLIILDVSLPDGSGLDLLSRLNQLALEPTPVLVLSADDVAEDVQQKVVASLVKSRISEKQIAHIIKSFINHEENKV